MHPAGENLGKNPQTQISCNRVKSHLTTSLRLLTCIFYNSEHLLRTSWPFLGWFRVIFTDTPLWFMIFTEFDAFFRIQKQSSCRIHNFWTKGTRDFNKSSLKSSFRALSNDRIFRLFRPVYLLDNCISLAKHTPKRSSWKNQTAISDRPAARSRDLSMCIG